MRKLCAGCYPSCIRELFGRPSRHPKCTGTGSSTLWKLSFGMINNFHNILKDKKSAIEDEVGKGRQAEDEKRRRHGLTPREIVLFP